MVVAAQLAQTDTRTSEDEENKDVLSNTMINSAVSLNEQQSWSYYSNNYYFISGFLPPAGGRTNNTLYYELRHTLLTNEQIQQKQQTHRC